MIPEVSNQRKHYKKKKNKKGKGQPQAAAAASNTIDTNGSSKLPSPPHHHSQPAPRSSATDPSSKPTANDQLKQQQQQQKKQKNYKKKDKKRKPNQGEGSEQQQPPQSHAKGASTSASMSVGKKRKRPGQEQQSHAPPQQSQSSSISSSSSSFKKAKEAAPSNGGGGPLSALQAKMKARLEGARFRDINEMLYKSTGNHALKAFSTEPELFDAYHKGFREQVAKWPRNPLDDMIEWIKKRPETQVIADFGCGEARLAVSVPNKVHSFDLIAPNERVIACDIAHVPLSSASVDVVVFCLSLMGTNMMDFMREAKRVLKERGIIKVAEVRSRFEGQEGGIQAFVEACRGLGLEVRHMDKSNKMFFVADFVKTKGGGRGATADGMLKGGKGAPPFQAKACVYKRR